MQKELYNEAFYTAQMQGSYGSAVKILPYIQKYIDVENVIDVGCGVGTWLKAWKDIKPDIKIFGIDGNQVSQELFMISTQHYQCVDLTQNAHKILKNIPITNKKMGGGKPFTLSQSLEVAEHLDARYAENFVLLLTSLSDVVLFSAAIPNQGGTHHVNEQPPIYWAELFAKYDYVCLDYIRMQIWNNPEIESWYRQNTLVFVHKQHLELFYDIKPSPIPPHLVHPELFRYYVQELQHLNNKFIIKILRKTKSVLRIIKRRITK